MANGKNNVAPGKSSTFVGTASPDTYSGGNGPDLVLGLGGSDALSGGNQKDVISGGSGADTISGNNGKDLLLGDGEPEYSTNTILFTDAALWSGLPAHSSSFALPGLTMQSLNGELFNFVFSGKNLGASVLSAHDMAPGQGWTGEIDAYNDAPEGLHLSFDVPQSSVSVTLIQLYAEKLYTPAYTPEKALVTLSFTDGTTQTITVQGVQTSQPGEAVINLDSSDFGGKYIAAIDLAPSLDTPPNVPPQYASQYNATHPYSEFTLKSVTYTRDANLDPGNDDTLIGGNGKDKLYGGLGNDKLFGGNGADLLVGGAGDNSLTGGNGPDTFVFGFSAKGHNVITDFAKTTDHIRLDEGITVTSVVETSGNTLLHLSNGGDVTLLGVTEVTDWHSLL